MKPILYLIAFATMCIVWGCKKENNQNINRNITAGDTLTYTLSYSGTPCISDTLTFTANEPIGTHYFWSFGDGSTSTSVSPMHQYAESGEYTVTLTFNGDTTRIASTQIMIFIDPFYTHLAEGTRTWQHKHYNVWSSGDIDSAVNDTALTVTFVNAVTLVFTGDTFTYSPSASSGNYIGYTFSFYTSPMQNSYGNGQLLLNYVNDSISIGFFTHPGPGEGIEYYDKYYAP